MDNINDIYGGLVSRLSNALVNEDYSEYDRVSALLDEAVESRKKEVRLMGEADTVSFSKLNYIIESVLPTLFKQDKKAVKAIVRTIKEDKSLRDEYAMYRMVMNYDSSNADKIGSAKLLESFMQAYNESLEPSRVQESNKKLRDVLKENGVHGVTLIGKEEKRLFESLDTMMTKKRTLSNTPMMLECMARVSEYMDSHAKVSKGVGEKAIYEAIDDFEEMLNENLTSSEKSIVLDMTSHGDDRKSACFEKFKNECLSLIEGLSGDGGDEASLSSLKDSVMSLKYTTENGVKDLAKLLEIRDILLEK